MIGYRQAFAPAHGLSDAAGHERRILLRVEKLAQDRSVIHHEALFFAGSGSSIAALHSGRIINVSRRPLLFEICAEVFEQEPHIVADNHSVDCKSSIIAKRNQIPALTLSARLRTQ